ncbi:MAG: prolyl aminopeptidase [Rhodospirillaceae bacterium]|nr:prolyl aminopeptidase [Rhodospirillaceae bacterium]
MEHSGAAPLKREVDDRPLYPALEPYRSGMLEVGRGHRLYWEESGNPTGVPIVFLHGGPGAGVAPAYRRFFDPTHYRIVLFDQRGAGRSTPEAEIQDNTTQALVADIEALRAKLKIERWLVFGGSWGSTLALAYGQAHPEPCVAFILRGVFLFSDEEIDWFMHGMRRFFPEAYRAFAHAVPEAERGDLLAAIYRRLTDPDPAVHKPAAAAWCIYENACSRLIPMGNPTPSREPVRTKRQPELDPAAGGSLAMARIECHYMINRGFLDAGQLLARMNAILKHPAIIVQGRYDMVCPIATADRLAQAWPGAQYRVVADAGHSSMEPGIRAALVKATDEFKIYR